MLSELTMALKAMDPEALKQFESVTTLSYMVKTVLKETV